MTSVVATSAVTATVQDEKKLPKKAKAKGKSKEVTVKSEVKTEEKRQRRVVTKESVLQDMEKLQKECLDCIESLRKNNTPPTDGTKRKKKVTGGRSLRGINKKLKVLTNDYRRVMRIKKTPAEGGASNRKSGFAKCYLVTPELRTFLTTNCGADFQAFLKTLNSNLVVVKEQYSRIDVTNILCAYVKFKNLQMEHDRRNIDLMKDLVLRKLLRYDMNVTNKENVVEPPQEHILYSGIQKRIGVFFVKSEEVSNGPITTPTVTTIVTTTTTPSVPRKIIKKVVANKK